ncbi:unnamed protein product [Rotaria sp. Silwood1]|nr:unnamed protein product [Rotaria sp. Silwood1]
MWPYDQPSQSMKFRLRVQNASAFQFLKFVDLVKLKNLCENMTTIQCLYYLHRNQTDYLQPLSADETRLFKETYCTENNKVLFHTFWGKTRFLNNQILQMHILSFLYTQNLQCCRLIVWLWPPLDSRIKQLYDQLYAPHVEFRTTMSVAEKLRELDIYVGSHWSGLPWRWFIPYRALFSDVLRFIILHEFGGIYIDVDALLLRDLQPFFSYEFGYRWSFLNGFNTGVLRLFAKSNVSSIIINRARQTKSPYEFFPSSLEKRHSLPANFYRLPSAFFDPIWLAVDEVDQSSRQEWKLSSGFLVAFKDPLRQQSEISRRGRSVFDGAFIFHWHASSTPKIFEPGSYLHQWSEFLNSEFFDK